MDNNNNNFIFSPQNIQERKIYDNSTDNVGALAARNNLRVKMPGSHLKEKMFKCLGQEHKNKEIQKRTQR